MKAEIIAIGSELLSPWRIDTDSLFITEELNRIGIKVWRKTIVGDRLEDLKQVFAGALSASELVFCIGGLGPTRDDLTREAIAEVMARPLAESEEVMRRLEQRFARIGVSMTANNRQQAKVPGGAQILVNPNGTAPGLLLRNEDCMVFLLPGPPPELKPMVSNLVIPAIQAEKPTSRLIYRQIRVASEGESRVDHLVSPIYRTYSEVETTILASGGVVDLLFYWIGANEPATAARVLDELVARVREQLGASVFTEGSESLEAVLGGMLRSLGRTVATAESCTGGAIGELLTDVPGSSEFYRGGMITYSNDSKTNWLGVPSTLIESHGAVSPEVAEAMAARIRLVSGADYGLSATGIAGPSGGTFEKPVGTVYLGMANGRASESKRLQLLGDREVVRQRTAKVALDWLRRQLL